MSQSQSHDNPRLPSPEEVRQAIQVYIQHAYGPQVPPAAEKFVPPADFEVGGWLMTDVSERDPANAPLQAVRSFALRIGNALYPHMKLRLSHPPKDMVFLFSVDSHDAFLQAKPGTSDYQMLEELKKHNSNLSAEIIADWDRLGLPTEHNYLRQKIRQAKLAPEEGDTIIG